MMVDPRGLWIVRPLPGWSASSIACWFARPGAPSVPGMGSKWHGWAEIPKIHEGLNRKKHGKMLREKSGKVIEVNWYKTVEFQLLCLRILEGEHHCLGRFRTRGCLLCHSHFFVPFKRPNHLGLLVRYVPNALVHKFPLCVCCSSTPNYVHMFCASKVGLHIQLLVGGHQSMFIWVAHSW